MDNKCWTVFYLHAPRHGQRWLHRRQTVLACLILALGIPQELRRSQRPLAQHARTLGHVHRRHQRPPLAAHLSHAIHVRREKGDRQRWLTVTRVVPDHLDSHDNHSTENVCSSFLRLVADVVELLGMLVAVELGAAATAPPAVAPLLDLVCAKSAIALCVYT